MRIEQILQSTALCRRLGIAYPIMQAGMGQVAYGRLAAAVSAAGGLGVIGAGYLTADELRREIRVIRDSTDKPFGVDILFAKVSGDDEASITYTRQVQDQIAVSLEERAPVLISGLGNPLGVVNEAHERGMTVMSVVGNVRQARMLEAQGVDMLIASGGDGGGHVGRVGTAALVPAVTQAVKIPVIAGGGLADGRGLLAALAFGAVGVWMGTRFIASEEARAHENYKNELVARDEEGTVISRAHSGKTVRMLRNSFTNYWDHNQDKILPYPRQLQEIGLPATIRGRIEGDIDNGVLPAGQSVGLIHAVKPAGEIVRDIFEEACAAYRQSFALEGVP
ncbi:nitronate monooxygenase family protein [Ferrovibrio sp.]|uniref:NAD(P)H-dependent flavin oxidoreductase n=1 Tax=Ferrovibrio sp. TaxID=1917215 RepID=UPI001BC179A4|nr:nitronate monooxygenase [Ferrovibrio sp.]MBS4046043.1 nitronate monooxygenase [Alphaproteobacteria bacterium]